MVWAALSALACEGSSSMIKSVDIKSKSPNITAAVQAFAYCD